MGLEPGTEHNSVAWAVLLPGTLGLQGLRFRRGGSVG